MSNDTTTAVTYGEPGGATGGQQARAIRGPLRGLAIALALLLVAVGAVSLVSFLARSTGHRGATYTGITTVETDLDFESLVVSSTETDRVRLDRSYSWSFGKPTVDERRRGDRLIISSSGCWIGPGLGCTGSVRLEVPRDVSLRLRTANSSVRLADLSGDIEASTSNGSIDVSRVSGPVTLHTSNGRIDGTGLQSSRVEASTSNGRVQLRFDTAPESAVARSSNGEVVVVVPRDGSPYRVDAGTSHGSTEITVPTDDAAERHIDVHTSNGAVHVLGRG